MPSHRCIATGPLLLSLALSACGDEASLPLSGYEARALDAFCTRAVFCQEYPDKATCIATTSLDLDQAMAAVNAGRIKYDGTAAARCLDALLASASVGCSFSAQGSLPAVPSCNQIATGMLAEGAACFAPVECVSENCDLGACTGTAMCCSGTCGPTMGRVPIGGDCTAPNARCEDGKYCRYANGIATAGRCAELIAPGQPCGRANGDLCAPGNFCLSDPAGGLQGVCGKAPAEGEACVPSLSRCDATTNFCDTGTMRCTPKIAVGGACPSGEGCVDYADCDIVTSTCVIQSLAGEACDATIGRPCMGSLQCQTGTCAFPPADPVCS